MIGTLCLFPWQQGLPNRTGVVRERGTLEAPEVTCGQWSVSKEAGLLRNREYGDTLYLVKKAEPFDKSSICLILGKWHMNVCFDKLELSSFKARYSSYCNQTLNAPCAICKNKEKTISKTKGQIWHAGSRQCNCCCSDRLNAHFPPYFTAVA